MSALFDLFETLAVVLWLLSDIIVFFFSIAFILFRLMSLINLAWSFRSLMEGWDHILLNVWLNFWPWPSSVAKMTQTHDLQWRRWFENLIVYALWCQSLTSEQQIPWSLIRKKLCLRHHHPQQWRILMCRQMYLAATLIVKSFQPLCLDRKLGEECLWCCL